MLRLWLVRWWATAFIVMVASFFGVLGRSDTSGSGLETAGRAFSESEFDFCDFHYDSSFVLPPYAHTLFHNLSADVAVLRDSAALVQKYRRAVCDTSALQEQVATHDSALQQLTEMLGMLVSGNPKVIADAVSRALQQFVESDVIAGAVRAELLRSPARDELDDVIDVSVLPPFLSVSAQFIVLPWDVLGLSSLGCLPGSAVLEIAGALVRAEAGAPEAADARGAQPAAAGAAASRPRAAKGRGRGAAGGGEGMGRQHCNDWDLGGRGEQPRVGKAAGARPGDGGLAEGDGARDAEARGNPSGQRAGPAHPSQSRGAGPAGSGPSGPRARGCDTCKGRYAEGDGCRDASGAGSWHCFGCWEAYYAAQREQQQTWQRPWHDQQQTWQRPWQAQQQTWQQPWHEQEQHQDWQRPVRQGNGGQEMGRGPKKQYNKIR
ncbi:unnamed protein product [Prorocentrum cordatum]|uniref:Uncharacterized protein n=1 Tax=Prorocentrum cordatum TaxID=2364126 RepID=A0ABN9VY14_9DINO|nr:unnamed protein product [Polarella glacialis]